MEHLPWSQSHAFSVCSSQPFPRDPCKVGTIVSSILQLGKLRLREVKMLFKQAATGPYSAFVQVTKDTPPLLDKVPG